MIFGKNARSNNDIIQSKYGISYVGEYVIKITVCENRTLGPVGGNNHEDTMLAYLYVKTRKNNQQLWLVEVYDY